MDLNIAVSGQPEEVMDISIAVSGQAEVGQSIVVNGLVGKELLKDGERENEIVRLCEWNNDDNNFRVKVYEIQALRDDMNADKFRETVKSKCSIFPNLLLYCISVQPAKVTLGEDKKNLMELKKVLNVSSWDHCIIVLTYANAIVKRSEARNHGRNSKKMIAADYNIILGEWTSEIRKILQELNIPKSGSIPILPAGTAKSYSILSDKRYWLSDLYHKAVETITKQQQDVLVLIGAHRLNTKVRDEDFDKNIFLHPLVVTKSSTVIRDASHHVVAGVGVGGAAGAVGATIGAIIGALAIGLPTFGVAAGVGLILGAAVGGGAGIGVGVGIAAAVKAASKYYTERKHELDRNVDMFITGGCLMEC